MSTMTEPDELLVTEPALLLKLRQDLRDAAENLGEAEARFLVDTYYMMQRNRIRARNQLRALAEDGEPHHVLETLGEASEELEAIVGSALDVYTRRPLLCQWARAQKGIGPVIAAGLYGHIDLEIARTAGAIWRFAGLDPTVKWEKGKKRPWNTSLKTLCWKIGESFVKVSSSEDAFYGQLYRARKEYEVARNEAGELAEQAARIVQGNPRHAQAATYKEGRLPAGHIHMRAKRWAVKIFLAHWFEVGKRLRGEEPPAPYAPTHLEEHAHRIEPPPPKLW